MQNRRAHVTFIAVLITCAACDDSAPVSPAVTRTARATLVSTDTPILETGIVINEFATRNGPDEECSEFVELRNDSSHEQSVGGWRIAVSDTTGGAVVYTIIPAGMVLQPGCHLLISTPPAGLVRDVASACNLPDAGGLALMRPNGTIVDQVGMGSGSSFGEGTPLATFRGGAVRSSYARFRDDTDNNATNFVFGAATPQNRFDDCTKR
jgi:uncharacterized protein